MASFPPNAFVERALTIHQVYERGVPYTTSSVDLWASHPDPKTRASTQTLSNPPDTIVLVLFSPRRLPGRSRARVARLYRRVSQIPMYQFSRMLAHRTLTFTLTHCSTHHMSTDPATKNFDPREYGWNLDLPQMATLYRLSEKLLTDVVDKNYRNSLQ